MLGVVNLAADGMKMLDGSRFASGQNTLRRVDAAMKGRDEVQVAESGPSLPSPVHVT